MIQHPVDTRKVLPENVFTGEWSAFLFFDSDWVFSSEFIDFCHEVLRQEPARAVEIVDLDDPQSLLAINAGSTWQKYRDFLNGQDFDGWLYDVHRFAISSDAQSWCIYLERDAEIAIFAYKTGCVEGILSFVTRTFKSLPILEMVKTQNTVAFHGKLASERFTQPLIQSYENGNHST